MKNRINILISIIAAIGMLLCHALAQPAPASVPTNEKVLTGYPQQNLIIPVKDLSKATIVIDNRAVVIDGIWNFKGVDGKVLDKPEIISQPRTVTDKLILAARATGQTNVTVTEDGEKTVYTVNVITRDPPPKQRSTAVMTIENSLEKLIGIPTVKITVLDSASDFLSEAAANSNISPVAPSTPTPTAQNATTQQNGTSSASSQTSQPVQNALPTFQPTIILEGEVGDDLDMRRALSLARAFSNNILNFIQVANPLQVRIKIQVISVELDNDSSIGLEYQGSDENATGYRTEFGANIFKRKLLDFQYPFFNIARSGGGDDLSIFLNLIKNKSKVKILQEPTLTILNGQSGHFRVGGMFPVNRRTIDSSGAILITTEYRPFGIGLLVTPLAALPNVTPGNVRTIGADDLVLGVPESGIANDQTPPGISNVISPTIDKNGIVKLYVRPSISSLDFTRVDADPVNHPDPIINERLVETRVALRDKESLIIGGLFDENFRESMKSVPFIEKVPILGELFKNRTNSGARTELVFVLTPHIVGRKQMEEGDYPKTKLPESDKYFNESGITTMASKPTRISASEVTPRLEEKKPEPKLDATPAPVPTKEEPKPIAETNPAVQTAPPVEEPSEPIYKAEDTTAAPPQPTSTEKTTATPATEQKIESPTSTEEKPAEFIPVNSFTPVEPNSAENKTPTEPSTTETNKIQEIQATPIESTSSTGTSTEPAQTTETSTSTSDQTSTEKTDSTATTTPAESTIPITTTEPAATITTPETPAMPSTTITWPTEQSSTSTTIFEQTPSQNTDSSATPAASTESVTPAEPVKPAEPATSSTEQTPTTETAAPTNQDSENTQAQKEEPAEPEKKKEEESPSTTSNETPTTDTSSSANNSTTQPTETPTTEVIPPSTPTTPSAENNATKPTDQPSPSDQSTVGETPNA